MLFGPFLEQLPPCIHGSSRCLNSSSQRRVCMRDTSVRADKEASSSCHDAELEWQKPSCDNFGLSESGHMAHSNCH